MNIIIHIKYFLRRAGRDVAQILKVMNMGGEFYHIFSVAHAHLSTNTTKDTEARKKPITELHLNEASSIFRTDKSGSLLLFYLTLQQLNVYDNCVTGVIESPAGGGKSILIQAKIIELFQSGSNLFIYMHFY